jgi:hypothetical protein
MAKMVSAVILAALLATPVAVRAQEDVWYAVGPDGICHPESSPANTIVIWQQMGLPYTTDDVTDPATGKIVQTTLTMTDLTIQVPDMYRRFTLYRGLGVCEAAIDAARNELNRANQQTIQKYR